MPVCVWHSAVSLLLQHQHLNLHHQAALEWVSARNTKPEVLLMKSGRGRPLDSQFSYISSCYFWYNWNILSLNRTILAKVVILTQTNATSKFQCTRGAWGRRSHPLLTWKSCSKLISLLLVAGRCCWPIQVISNVFLRQFWFYFWRPGGRAGAVDQSKLRPRASFWSISSDSTILQLASIKCTKPHCIVSTVFKWWHCSDVPIYFCSSQASNCYVNAPSLKLTCHS